MADIILKNAQGVDETLTGVDSLVVPKSGGGTVTFSVAASPPATPTDAVLFYSLKPFNISVADRTKRWDGTLYYSTDYSSWNTWNGITKLDAGLSSGYYKLYMRGLNNTKITSATSGQQGWTIGGTEIHCVGNLNRLLSYNNDITELTSTYVFSYLFVNWGNVLFDVTLPATKLTNYCYDHMFYGCSSLTTAPALPATTLATYCYSNMFGNCISLTTAPELPATTLATYCYSNMFYFCSSLVISPALPATTLESSCYAAMFQYCSSLTTVSPISATTLATNCCNQMFYYCKSLTVAPSISASTTASSCYNNMFGYCSSLTTAPALPATTLESSCYAAMFQYCTSLTSLPALPATTLANYCYSQMFYGCTNIKMSTSKTGAYQTEYRIPSSGTGTTASSALQNMFTSTGGTFKGTAAINVTYYTSNTVIPAT